MAAAESAQHDSAERRTALQHDADLVQETLAGEESAYAELYDRYARLIRAVCFDVTSDVAAAQDLAQEAFLVAWRRLETLRDPQKYSRWLIAIAHNTCRRWCRDRSRDRRGFVGLQPGEGDKNPAADGPPPDDEQLSLLRAAISGLPRKERLALHLLYLLGRSAEDARAVLGLSRSGFYRALEQARDRLKRMMSPDGRTLP